MKAHAMKKEMGNRVMFLPFCFFNGFLIDFKSLMKIVAMNGLLCGEKQRPHRLMSYLLC